MNNPGMLYYPKGNPSVPAVPVALVQFDADGTWLCPQDVRRIRIRAWGGGGGGVIYLAGGGGGGAYGEMILEVIPGRNYEVKIGAGGVPGINGGDTKFDGIAIAGGGAAASGGGAGGTSPATIHINGQDGAVAGGSAPCGGGGGSGNAGGAPGGGGGGGASAGNGASGLLLIEY